jgi:hypothetical protein
MTEHLADTHRVIDRIQASGGFPGDVADAPAAGLEAS